MAVANKDFELLRDFKFDVQPVGVKFSLKTPDHVARLDKNLALCEMLPKAQRGNVFYADVKNHTCDAGAYVLGQSEAPSPFIGGEFGARLKIFEQPRSASRLYLYIPKIAKNVVNYVTFSPLNKLTFDPDILIFLANVSQTEILLRAMSYKTGQMWQSNFSAAIGCAWIYVYPYLTGKLNYTTTGLGHGMKRRNLFPEGQQLISIPFDLFCSMLKTLREMPWVLPAYKRNGQEFVKKVLIELGLNRKIVKA